MIPVVTGALRFPYPIATNVINKAFIQALASVARVLSIQLGRDKGAMGSVRNHNPVPRYREDSG
jgi:hypothetical protein